MVLVTLLLREAQKKNEWKREKNILAVYVRMNHREQGCFGTFQKSKS